MKSILNKIGLLVIIIPLFATYSCNNASNEENQENQKILQERITKIQEEQRIINSITSVLQSDHDINFTYYNPKGQAEAMRDIDISNCPSDFSVAYLDHIHAWENAARVDKVWKEWNSDENISNIFVVAFLNELSGANNNIYENVVEIENELQNQRDEANKKIRTTWEEVERIAVSYGVKLSAIN